MLHTLLSVGSDSVIPSIHMFKLNYKEAQQVLSMGAATGTLDIILTSKVGMVNSITYLPPIDNSD